MELIYKKEAYEIVGAAMEVHKQLGNGFLEAVYQEAMEIELATRLVPHKPLERLNIRYKNTLLSKVYVADLLCYEKIIVELKALSSLTTDHEAQVLNYLKATGFKLGILINFGQYSLVFKRIVL